MAYTVAQTYAYEEFQHGTTTLRFVISNDYNALYNEEVDIETDIFMLDSVAEDLNLEQGSFAVDEIQFSADAAACQSTDDERAIAFALGCTDVTKNRFCALFINPTFTAGVVDIGTKKFVGKMVTKVGAEDTGWHEPAQYSADTRPLRNWKFSALSFDISVLEQITMDMFYDGYFKTGNTTETPDIAAIPTGTMNALFEHKPFYSSGKYDTPNSAQKSADEPMQTTYVANLGNLKTVIQTYLDHAAKIMEHLLTGSYSGTPIFTLELLDSDLGIGGIPARYDFERGTNNPLGHVINSHNARTDVDNPIIPLAITDDLDSAVFVHRGMMVPVFAVNDGGDLVSIEKDYSFRGCESISDLLFKIGKSFGCYVQFKFVSANHITIQIVSRQGVISDGYTYIQDVTKATLDMSSTFTKKNEKVFVGRSSNWALDGYDVFDYEVKLPENWIWEADAQPSKNLSNLQARDKVRSTERLLLTTSHTIQEVGLNPDTLLYMPQNTVSKHITGPYAGTVRPFIGDDHGTWFTTNCKAKEYIHTAIYTRIDLTDTEISDDFLGYETHAWRPIVLIMLDVNGEQTAFNSLTTYCNYTFARDGVFYETERSLSVPFWSGFSHSEDGASPSWKNIRNGSRIKQVEHKLLLDEDTNEWTDTEVTDEYVVVGIKTNLRDPGIDLKLHKVGRFAYGTWSGETVGASDTFSHPTQVFAGSENQQIQPQLKSYICGEDITQYYAVTVQVDETIIHSRSIASHYRKIVGIALETKLETELCLVQIGGRCIIPTASFEAGKPVFVRTGTWNVTQDALTAGTAEENLYFKIGKADGPNSFIFDIEQYKFNNTALI